MVINIFKKLLSDASVLHHCNLILTQIYIFISKKQNIYRNSIPHFFLKNVTSMNWCNIIQNKNVIQDFVFH